MLNPGTKWFAVQTTLKEQQKKSYSGVLLVWEFFIKRELPALLPPSFKKEEYWREDGCK